MDKQHILDEIRRTATENGCKPLGAQAFQRETGIRRSDWLGKHWARWGDALQECGFEPNTLQTALDDENLIGLYIGLIRELSKFPTDAEVKMKTRRSPGFPWPETFARLGSKRQLAERVLEYCGRHLGNEDVAAL